MISEDLVYRLNPLSLSTTLMMLHQSKNLKALVLELYGTGNAPCEGTSLISAIQRARNRGIIGRSSSTHVWTNFHCIGQISTAPSLVLTPTTTTAVHASWVCVQVAACTQCSMGGVLLGKYAVSTALEAAGVIGAGDMTTVSACHQNIS
jgi:L-asparaginase/Glu-tRNA(Gln) amidotransferase subunit D